MWVTHVLSKTEQAIACIESALIETPPDEAMYEDLMVSLARLVQVKRSAERKAQWRRDEEILDG